jgi:hypothetical protein
MKVRAITVGNKIPYLLDDKEFEERMERNLQNFYSFNYELIQKLNEKKIEVQTNIIVRTAILF